MKHTDVTSQITLSSGPCWLISCKLYSFKGQMMSTNLHENFSTHLILQSHTNHHILPPDLLTFLEPCHLIPHTGQSHKLETTSHDIYTIIIIIALIFPMIQARQLNIISCMHSANIRYYTTARNLLLEFRSVSPLSQCSAVPSQFLI